MFSVVEVKAHTDIDILENGTEMDENLLNNNSLLEIFVEYCWHKYRSQSVEYCKRLIKSLLSKNNTVGGIIERNLKSELECVLGFLSKCNNDAAYVNEDGQTIFHILFTYHMHIEAYIYRNLDLTTRRAERQVITNLIKSGGSIIAVDYSGKTALEMALENKMYLVRSLPRIFDSQDADFDIMNSCNSLGETVLHIITKTYPRNQNLLDTAFQAGDRSNQEQLIYDYLANGANFNITNIYGMTAIHYAAMKCYCSVLQMYKHLGADLQQETDIGDNLLILACKNITMVDNFEKLSTTIDWLLDQGIDLNHRNHGGHTALHYAAQSNEIDLITKLVELGADVNAVAEFDNTTPLHAAVMSSNVGWRRRNSEKTTRFVNSGVVDYLMERGCDVQLEESEFGFSMLHLAALNRDETIFEKFIARDYNVDKPSKNGLTPLHLAAMSANVEVVKELIELGANVHCRENTWQYTPLHLAAMGGQFRSLDEMDVLGREDQLDMNQLSLIRHCFRRLKFKIDAETDYKSVIDLLLKAGAEIEAKDIHGWTPLHCAVQQSEAHLVEILLKAGADIDALENDGHVPLQTALLATADNTKAIQYLLKYGANIIDVEKIIENIYNESTISKFSIAEDLAIHMAKLKYVQLLPDEHYMPPGIRSTLRQVKTACLQEMESMKERTLMYNVSVYDVLHMKPKQRACFVQRLPADLHYLFPNYYIVIQGRCYEAANRGPLVEPEKLAFDLITGVYWPDLCIEGIFSFLNNRDLNILINSVPKMDY